MTLAIGLPPDAQLTGVNDSGVVVGTSTFHNGTFGFLFWPGSAFGLPFQRIMVAAP
jgi:probable HAF family extracellular repeat protein